MQHKKEVSWSLNLFQVTIIMWKMKASFVTIQTIVQLPISYREFQNIPSEKSNNKEWKMKKSNPNWLKHIFTEVRNVPYIQWSN